MQVNRVVVTEKNIEFWPSWDEHHNISSNFYQSNNGPGSQMEQSLLDTEFLREFLTKNCGDVEQPNRSLLRNIFHLGLILTSLFL